MGAVLWNEGESMFLQISTAFRDPEDTMMIIPIFCWVFCIYVYTLFLFPARCWYSRINCHLGGKYGVRASRNISKIFSHFQVIFSLIQGSCICSKPLTVFQSSDRFDPDSFLLVFQYFRYFSKEMWARSCRPCHAADADLRKIFQTPSRLGGLPGEQIQTQRTAHGKLINVCSCVNTSAGKRSCRTGDQGSLGCTTALMNSSGMAQGTLN